MIYLDNNASTKPYPEVLAAMAEVLEEGYANPSSLHQAGQAARHRVECAREQVARLIGAKPREIIFTGGGTESINLAIKGFLRAQPEKRRLVTTTVEHPAVLAVAREMEEEGFEVETVGVDSSGRIDEAEWEARLTHDTALASILHANNETGVLWDVERLAGVAAQRGVAVHVDAVQSAGKIPIDVSRWPVQLLSLGGHKFHGPKGVGALYIRQRTRIEPMIVGGPQERELRGGTENVEGIVGMGVAARIAQAECQEVALRVGGLRDAFERQVLEAVPFARTIAAHAPRLYNTSNIGFCGLQSDAILLVLSEAGICASAGAACSSGSLEPSHVLKAMGIEEAAAHGAIRFSLSRWTTGDEIRQVAAALPQLLSRLTSLVPR